MVLAAPYASWLELAGELLQQPDGVLGRSHEELAALFVDSFGAACCTRNRVSPAWLDRVEDSWPRGYLPTTPPGGVVVDATWQPLLRWYAVSGSTSPQVLSRVPEAVADRRVAARWQDFARPLGIASQLSIPVQADDEGLVAYVLGRPDGDFGEEGEALARLVQPVLVALCGQRAALAAAPATAVRAATAVGLTGRELAVLTLLGKGLTAASIARRLGASPRTVDKHLEHIYRKLGVRDRLMAVMSARDGGLLDLAPQT